jgi:hypothetical protein
MFNDSEPKVSVLPPLFQPNSNNQNPKTVHPIEVKPSKKLRFILSLYKLGLYGFWFGVGVGAANLTRLFPSGWIVYLALVASSAGYLMLLKPAEATEEMLSLRRISGLALIVSAAALWDGVLAFLNLPFTLGFWVFPIWLVVLSGIAFLAGAWMTISASNQRR